MYIVCMRAPNAACALPLSQTQKKERKKRKEKETETIEALRDPRQAHRIDCICACLYFFSSRMAGRPASRRGMNGTTLNSFVCATPSSRKWAHEHVFAKSLPSGARLVRNEEYMEERERGRVGRSREFSMRSQRDKPRNSQRGHRCAGSSSRGLDAIFPAWAAALAAQSSAGMYDTKKKKEKSVGGLLRWIKGRMNMAGWGSSACRRVVGEREEEAAASRCGDGMSEKRAGWLWKTMLVVLAIRAGDSGGRLRRWHEASS